MSEHIVRGGIQVFGWFPSMGDRIATTFRVAKDDVAKVEVYTTVPKSETEPPTSQVIATYRSIFDNTEHVSEDCQTVHNAKMWVEGLIVKDLGKMLETLNN